MQTQFPKVELPQIPQRVYRIEEYGAVKGGEVSNTEAIRKAIEAAHEAGGGRVVVGEGIWLTGPVELLSHVELHVEQGGLLLFHKHDEEYPLLRSNYEGESRIRGDIADPCDGSDGYRDYGQGCDRRKRTVMAHGEIHEDDSQAVGEADKERRRGSGRQ